jgi:p-aminobenzoyl-glutamate transporter AbgT
MAIQTKIRNWFRFLAAFIILGIGLALVADKIILPLYVHHGRESEMIDVREKSVVEAIQQLEINGFTAQVVDTVESGNHPRGIVLDQQPPPAVW